MRGLRRRCWSGWRGSEGVESRRGLGWTNDCLCLDAITGFFRRWHLSEMVIKSLELVLSVFMPQSPEYHGNVVSITTIKYTSTCCLLPSNSHFLHSMYSLASCFRDFKPQLHRRHYAVIQSSPANPVNAIDVSKQDCESMFHCNIT